MSVDDFTVNYGVWDNVCFMFRIAWTTRKSVIWICGVLAILNVSINLIQLLIAPKILEKVESLASVWEIVNTVVVFSIMLFILQALDVFYILSELDGFCIY